MQRTKLSANSSNDEYPRHACAWTNRFKASVLEERLDWIKFKFRKMISEREEENSCSVQKSRKKAQGVNGKIVDNNNAVLWTELTSSCSAMYAMHFPAHAESYMTHVPKTNGLRVEKGVGRTGMYWIARCLTLASTYDD